MRRENIDDDQQGPAMLEPPLYPPIIRGPGSRKARRGNEGGEKTHGNSLLRKRRGEGFKHKY